jgi:hypothetical protein
MRWCYKRCTELCWCYMRSCDCAACGLLLQVIFGKLSSRNCPQYFGTGPIDQGGTRHGGSAAWISRTSVFVWPDLGNLGPLQLVIRALLAGGIRELSNAGGIRWLVEVLHFISSHDGGGFQRGSARHVAVASFRGTTRQVVASYRYRGSTRHVVAAYQGTMPSLRLSVGEFYLLRFNPMFFFRRRGFFSLTDSPYLSHAHLIHRQADT